MESRYSPGTTHVAWTAWPVSWSAVWVGALSSLAAALIFGLIGTAIGATSFKTFSSWSTLSRIDVAIAVLSAFFAFVIGGWVTAKIAGIGHSEPGILHAAVSWLVTLPLLAVSLALGAGSAYGSWYGGIAGTLGAAAPAVPPGPDVIRGTALAALTAILVGLMGAVVGGWMATGEPMTFTHYRKRGAMPPEGRS